jgi:hypothetical protein
MAAAAALAAFAALRWSRARPFLGLSAVGCFVAAGAVTVVGQVRHHYPAGSSWPHNFESAGVLAMIGVVVLAVDTTVELARRGRARGRGRGRDVGVEGGGVGGVGGGGGRGGAEDRSRGEPGGQP